MPTRYKTVYKKITSLGLTKLILENIEPGSVLTLKRFRKPLGEVPSDKLKSIIVEEDSILIEDIYGELIALPLDCLQPTLVYQPTEENKYFVTVPLLDFLTLTVLIRTRLRYDSIKI